MNRLIDKALADLRTVKSGSAAYPDDKPFVVTRFEGARLMELDPSVHRGTVKPQRLLRNDGTIVTTLVESVRRPGCGYDKRNASFEGARIMTARSFLSANAIRSKDSLDDIDWCSSNNSTKCAVEHISIPLLVTAMGAHYFIRNNEIHYDAAMEAALQEQHWTAWLGESIPALGGKTPRQAARTQAGREMLNALLNEFEWRGGAPVARLRAVLKL